MGFSVLATRKKEGEPFFVGGLTLIPCSLLRNHMETLATQASNGAQFCCPDP